MLAICTRVFSEPTYGLKVSFVYVYKTRLLLYKATTLHYQNMASCEKEKLFEKQTNLRSTAQHTKLLKCNVLDSCINSFQNKIKEGPYYICSVCNRILYRKTVIQLKKNKMAQLTYENRNLKEMTSTLLSF